VEIVKMRSWRLAVKGLLSVSGWALVSAVLVALTLAWPVAAADKPKVLRVCADPDNLPFSNKQSEGFENKIAEVVARDLGATLEYYWWPHQRGLVRNTLGAGICDVLISIPKGYDPVLWTKPYYRSAYVLAQLNGRGAKIPSLDDPVLKQLKIGTHAGSPPYDALAERGLSANMVTYPLFFDSRARVPDRSRRPTKLLEDVLTGEVDIAAAWGPIAGYFVKAQSVGATLSLLPLADDRIGSMTFEFSMGVRKRDQALKDQLEQAIDRRQAEITKILDDFGVPLLPLKPAAPATEGRSTDKTP
jgi:quinoprotein dehydrogenase-associated probable ABC transporter substrate-binding protein